MAGAATCALIFFRKALNSVYCEGPRSDAGFCCYPARERRTGVVSPPRGVAMDGGTRKRSLSD